MVVVQCECGKTLTAPEGSTARTGVCPNCGQTLKLPQTLPSRPDHAEHVAEMLGHRGTIRCAAFSPDERLLATAGGSDGDGEGVDQHRFAELHLWDVALQREVIGMQGHQDAILCAAFTPNGERLITGSKDRTLIVWDVSRGLHDVVIGLKEQTLRGHGGRVSSVSVTPDGRRLVSASDDGALKWWNSESWQCDQTVDTGRLGLCKLQHSADGSMLAAVWRGRGPAIIWSTKKHEESLRLALRPEEDTQDFDLAFSPDGAFLAVASEKLVRVWDLSSCQVAVVIDTAAQSIAYSPDGRLLATGGLDIKSKFDVQLWDPLTGNLVDRLNGQHNSVYAVCFSLSGERLACGGSDLAAHLWEL